MLSELLARPLATPTFATQLGGVMCRRRHPVLNNEISAYPSSESG